MEPRFVNTKRLVRQILRHVNIRQPGLELMESQIVQYDTEYCASLPSKSLLDKGYACHVLRELLALKKFESEIWETIGTGLEGELGIIEPIVEQQTTLGLDRIEVQAVYRTLLNQAREFGRFAMEVVLLSRAHTLEVPCLGKITKSKLLLMVEQFSQCVAAEAKERGESLEEVSPVQIILTGVNWFFDDNPWIVEQVEKYLFVTLPG